MHWGKLREVLCAVVLLGCSSSARPADGGDATHDLASPSDTSDATTLSDKADAGAPLDGSIDAASVDVSDAQIIDAPNDLQERDADATHDADDGRDGTTPEPDGSPDATDAASDASEVGDDTPGRWECPRDWVRYEAGGCGPAVLLCAADGGAASGACEGVDITRPHAVTDPDGGIGTSFYRLPDGGIGGGWSATPWTCPTGWRSLSDGTCDPAIPTDCPAGSSPLPGGRCTSTAMRDCPSGEFADVSAEAGAARVVHVRAGVTAGGDGSVGAPFATITDGVRAAGDGGWVLLAAGTYPEAVVITSSVHVVGRCAAMVRVEVPEAMSRAGAEVSGASTQADLRGITLTGRHYGAYVHDGGTLVLRASAVVDSAQDGVFAEGTATHLTLDDVRVANTHPSPDGEGFGVKLEAVASATLRNLAVEGSRVVGVHAGDNTASLTLEDSRVFDTRPVEGQPSAGVWIHAGSHANIRRVMIDTNSHWGCLTTGRDARTTLSDVLITHTILGGIPDSQHGGLGARESAQVTATRMLLRANYAAGAHTRAGGAVLELSDSVIEETGSDISTRAGDALVADGDSTLRAARCVLRNNEGFGLASSTEIHDFPTTSRLEATDTLVEETLPGTEGFWGTGIGALVQGNVTANRVFVVGSTELAVGAAGLTNLSLTDVIVARSSPGTRGYGIGLGVAYGANLRFDRLAVIGVHGAALLTDQHVEAFGLPPGFPLPRSSIVGRDLFVRGVAPSQVSYDPMRPTVPTGEPQANGVSVGTDTSIDLTRALIARGQRGLAIFAPLAIHDGVIADQDSAGVRNTTSFSALPTLDRVLFVRNTSPMISVDNSLIEGRLPVTRN